MRWIAPFISLAMISSAWAERAVYTGSLKAQNLAYPSASSVVKVAEVIDLETGKIVTVALSGTKLNFTYNVGSEVACVIAKATDAKKRSTTAIAQAAAAVDANGSKFALSTILRGTDVAVTLGDSGVSHWPRSLVGSGSLVASAGVDATAVPGGISLSTISLALSLPYSQLANNSGGTLEQCAEVVGQTYRDAVAKSLKYPVTNGTASAGSGVGSNVTTTTGSSLQLGSSGSVAVNGVGTLSGSLLLNPGFGGSLGLGATQVPATAITTVPYFPVTSFFNPSGSSIVGEGGVGSIVKTGSGTLQLNTPPAYNPPLGGTLTIGSSSGSSVSYASGATLTISRAPAIGGSLSFGGTNTYTGSVIVNGGTLDLSGGTAASLANLTGTGNLVITAAISSTTASQLAGWTAVDATGASITIGSPEFNALLTTGRFTGSIPSRTLTFQPNPSTTDQLNPGGTTLTGSAFSLNGFYLFP